MTRTHLILRSRAIETRVGSVRVVSRVDSYRLGRMVAVRHRPVAVEVTRDGRTSRRRVPDPGFLVAALSYALSVVPMFRSRR